MPATHVYSVDFGGGNLAPSVDANSWGAMKIGHSGAGNNPVSAGEPQGLALTVTATEATQLSALTLCCRRRSSVWIRGC